MANNTHKETPVTTKAKAQCQPRGITEKALSKDRGFLVHTSSNQPSQSALKFWSHQMTVFMPLRTSELRVVRDAIDEHIKANGL